MAIAMSNEQLAIEFFPSLEAEKRKKKEEKPFSKQIFRQTRQMVVFVFVVFVAFVSFRVGG